MKRFAFLVLLLAAAPLMAEDKPAQPSVGDMILGGKNTMSKEGKLELGEDRLGLGLDWKILSIGFDDNVLNVDRHEDTSGFIDSLASAFWGLQLPLIQVGVRGKAGYRYIFDAENQNLYDLRVGGFVRHVPENKGGHFGLGLSADLIYQQATFYELTGPILRFDQTKRVGAIARAHFLYNIVDYVGIELGVTGNTSDFSEENLNASADYWEIGTDFAVYLRFWDFLQLKPNFKFDYDWFRDVYDQKDDGSLSSTGDKLQLLKFKAACEVRVNILGLVRIIGNVQVRRQDDSAQGFQRYWEYGFDAATEFNISIVRINGGVKGWSREYTDRFRLSPSGDEETVFERLFGVWVEARAKVYWQLYVGLRVDWERRTSDIDNRGYANAQYQAFFGLEF